MANSCYPSSNGKYIIPTEQVSMRSATVPIEIKYGIKKLSKLTGLVFSLWRIYEVISTEVWAISHNLE